MADLTAAIEAAARTMYAAALEDLNDDDREAATQTAKAMVEAAAPHIAAATLEEAAAHWQSCLDNDCGMPHGAKWLRDKAKAIRAEAS